MGTKGESRSDGSGEGKSRSSKLHQKGHLDMTKDSKMGNHSLKSQQDERMTYQPMYADAKFICDVA